MKKVLVINASTRDEKSQSRTLTKLFVETWSKNYPEDRYTYREVGLTPVPHITSDWITASFIKPADRTKENQEPLALSNMLVKELQEADIYVLGVPMYNWSIPSGLKSYIDQVMRINETWKFRSGEPDGDYVGLLSHKKLFILSSRGDSGYGLGEPNAHMNFQTTYLKTIFTIMGVKDIEIISLDNEEYGGALFAKSQLKIHKQIVKLK
ncbi:NAD(P)H-dependent oxidoreductase [Sphingobacterium sp. SRCM116780]|uniref:FMN-dependent NADH-azoreductase n=1 Tax=Sphingobacterium sp. SRCM116780 TaxID=2907623 RepID=UPI001F4039DF|nr:NAD(P)H-dependent oxidoreductase [Sphingobacterium sp. SRCM116780]UIR54663.1 NAD(P)H-dependent oxidoreductase [Sphingobacterium sp. SRCM116780]